MEIYFITSMMHIELYYISRLTWGCCWWTFRHHRGHHLQVYYINFYFKKYITLIMNKLEYKYTFTNILHDLLLQKVTRG